MGLNLINASNGNGEAVRASVTAIRAQGSTTLKVDSLTNWPANFIATSGKLLPDGDLDPETVVVFFGHLTGSDIIIDGFAPGYDDDGSKVSDVVLIKPTTLWADQIAETLEVSLENDGTLNENAIEQVLSSGQIAEDLRIKPRISSAASGNIAPNIDEYNYYRRTGATATVAVANPIGTPNDGEGLLIEITGTAARAITWGDAFVAKSQYGLSLPSTTVTTNTTFVTFVYNEALTKYVAVM